MAVKTGRIWAFIVNQGRKWEESGYAAQPAGASPGKSTCRGPKRSPGLGGACRLARNSRTNKQPGTPGVWADRIFHLESINAVERARLWSLFYPFASRVSSSRPPDVSEALFFICKPGISLTRARVKHGRLWRSQAQCMHSVDGP